MSKWEWKKLGEICDSINGLWKGKKEPFIKVGVIRNTNFTKDCKLDLNPNKLELLDVEKKQYDKRKLQYGDLIVEKSGGSEKQPVGRVVLFEENEGEYSFSNFTSVLRIKNNNEIECHFLHLQLYKLYLDGVTKPMQSATTGIHNLDFDQFKDLSIGFPSLNEQKRIVKFLDEEFSKIDALKTNAETNLKNAKELFETTLEKELNPGKNGALPSGWEWKSLQEISNVYGEYGLSVPSTSYNGIRYLRITDITDDGRLNDEYVSADIEKVEESDKLQEGDILFARTGATVGKTLIFKEDYGCCVFAGYLIRYRPKKEVVLPFYLHYVTHSKYYFDWVKKSQKAAAQPNISAKLYNAFQIPLPPLSVQKEIVARLDKLSENVKRLEANYKQIIANCDELKKTILKQTFQG